MFAVAAFILVPSSLEFWWRGDRSGVSTHAGPRGVMHPPRPPRRASAESGWFTVVAPRNRRCSLILDLNSAHELTQNLHNRRRVLANRTGLELGGQ